MTVIEEAAESTIYESQRYRVSMVSGVIIEEMMTGARRFVQEGHLEDEFLQALDLCRNDDPITAMTQADSLLSTFFDEP